MGFFDCFLEFYDLFWCGCVVDVWLFDVVDVGDYFLFVFFAWVVAPDSKHEPVGLHFG